MWQSDFELSPYKYAVGLSVEPDAARRLKGNMRVDFYFEPTKQIVLRGLKFESPTVDSPTDREVFFKTMVGSIPCALISDQDGKVLKIVKSIDSKR